jgi:hypothetical protein
MGKLKFRRKIFVHIIYGIVLFITCLSTLEQFSELNNDIFHLHKIVFHIITFSISLVVALYEGYSMKGFDRIKALFETKEHIPDLPAEGSYSYRALALEEISKLYELAKKIYGSDYNFTEKGLNSWWLLNPNCFYGLFFENNLAGYIDAFPISDSSYKHLVDGHDERYISPQLTAQISFESSFYIASFVVRQEHSGHVLSFILEALKFYDITYPHKKWVTISALAYTPKGLEWCKCKGMSQVGESDIWNIDRTTLALLTPKNKIFWKTLLPPLEESDIAQQ